MHDSGEALTAMSVDSYNEKLVTADTKGRFKLWDISGADLRAGWSE